MRKMRIIVLAIVALVFAGTASAFPYTVTAVQTNVCSGVGDSCLPSDLVEVDIVVDTNGALTAGYTMTIGYDPGVLSLVSAVPIAPAGLPQEYWYPSTMLLTHMTWGAAVTVNAAVMNLVFHVMDVSASTITVVEPIMRAAQAEIFLDGGFMTVPATQVTLTGASIHVPEPTTTMLMGLGLLGILYAGRRR